MQIGKKLRIAAYLRLSKAESTAAGEKGTDKNEIRRESNSIRMQRLMIDGYVKTHFENYELTEYLDDGYSGTHFNRPGVKAMLEAVRKAELDCIIVKDFSRFSRDYIELGAYIDQIFPFMGIRVISINDGYDSAKCSGSVANLDISFRNLLYDLYSKDLSVKVKASFAVSREKGQYISANCPFGYRKAEDDRHMLLIEEKEARIVRRIFDMAGKGMTSTQIARTLNCEGVKTPMEFRLEKGEGKQSAKEKRFSWSSSGICRILKNEAYVGAMVYGKYYKNEVGGSNHLKPRQEWRVMYDHHAPVIDRDAFEAVQRKRAGINRAREEKTEAGREKPEEKKGLKHPLAGKLICQGCGRNLQLRRGTNPYFTCAGLYDAPKKSCVRKVNAALLEQYVLYEIQQNGWGISDEDRLKDGGKLLEELVPPLIDKINVWDEEHMQICWKEGAF